MRSEAFDSLDREFAALLQRLEPRASEPLALAAMLVSRAIRTGHVCIDLRRPPTLEGGPSNSKPARLPTFEAWRAELASASVVGQPGEFKPLILDPHGRLYLHRYWTYETLVADGIKSRLTSPGTMAPSTTALLDRYFGPRDSTAPDWQRQAVETALSRRFTVISGGPGTGKTHTIAILVAALLESAGRSAPRIALAAPTGKAAVRLQEALQIARQSLPCPAEVRAQFPENATTVHRLLGAVPGAVEPRYHATNPLPFEVILIDEASMVDLALMAKLFAACRPATRLVLVGDMDQLASVEAGAVLGDICDGVRTKEERAPEPGQGDIHTQTASSALSASIVQLRKNHRFRDGEGIAALSRALNAGEADLAMQHLNSGGNGALQLRSLPTPETLASTLQETISRHFDTLLALASQPEQALRQLAGFRILCALRKGPYGTEAINAGIENLLRRNGQIRSTTPFYPGRPVLILRNDYNLRLFNGDVGLVLPHPDTGELRAWFLDAEGRAHDFAPGRLPEHETVFAMTVHKSQGSEFQDLLMILPDRDSPVLTRELIYTGVTRARRRVELWLDEPTLRLALARRTERASGLASRLWEAVASADLAPTGR